MKLRLQVVILTMALLVAGASSAFAFPSDPHVEPVVPGSGAPPCIEEAPGPVVPGDDPDDIDQYNLATIPLDKVCPPPPPGQYWYNLSTPIGRIRVGPPRLSASLGTPPHGDVHRVEVPVKIELDEGGSVAPDWSLEELNNNNPTLNPLFFADRAVNRFRLPSEGFYRPGTVLRLTFYGVDGSETVFNPRIGQYSVRSVIGETRTGGRILLPQVSVSINLTVPRP
jgi:hypothetical protein